MSVLTAPAVSSTAVLYDIDWGTYTRFLKVFGKKRFRHTYDRGRLEIMSPINFEHDNPSTVLHDLVVVLTEELNLIRFNGGSTTLRFRKKARGLEPDKWYWIKNATRMRGKKGAVDFRLDPPPDLAVEVEVSRTVLKRLKIYASLGVPEVWRLRGGDVKFYQLSRKKYAHTSASLAFPHLKSADLTPFVARAGLDDDCILVKQFREWVKQQLPVWQAQEMPPA